MAREQPRRLAARAPLVHHQSLLPVRRLRLLPLLLTCAVASSLLASAHAHNAEQNKSQLLAEATIQAAAARSRLAQGPLGRRVSCNLACLRWTVALPSEL